MSLNKTKRRCGRRYNSSRACASNSSSVERSIVRASGSIEGLPSMTTIGRPLLSTCTGGICATAFSHVSTAWAGGPLNSAARHILTNAMTSARPLKPGATAPNCGFRRSAFLSVYASRHFSSTLFLSLSSSGVSLSLGNILLLP